MCCQDQGGVQAVNALLTFTVPVPNSNKRVSPHRERHDKSSTRNLKFRERMECQSSERRAIKESFTVKGDS